LTLEPAPPAPIHGDAKHLGRAVKALLDNAIRFSPDGGAVQVRVAATGTGCQLTVTDSGPGIPTEFLPRLFEEFAVADVAHHTQGHGLGLATARLIAERHAGSLVLESEAGRTGAAFRLDLPSVNGRATRG
jgi:signal transduction histidine kinase